ncbi:MAG: hypothetical protein IKB56_02950 [Clostridia bacterium]|nr:hypothetical protein [Clostridia bacterium]
MQKLTVEKLWKWNTAVGIIVALLLSALQHFLYDIIPLGVIGVFAPRGESLAEHVKIVFYPMLIWWTITYLIFRKSKGINVYKWFSSAIIATVVSVSLLVMQFSVIFYGFSLTMDSFLVHILIEIISFALAFLIGFHWYKHAKESKILFIFCLVLLGMMVILMGVFSFYPPKVPIFMEP